MLSVLRRFAVAYLMELRLICLHWSYVLLHLLWTSLLIYTIWNQDLGTAHFALESDFGTIATALISLVALFMAGASASRGLRLRFAAPDDTFPTGSEVPLGRWLAVLTALMGFTLQPLLFALRQGPLSSFLAALPVFVGETLIIVAFSTIVAWWLMTLLGRHGRWVYLLFVGGWLGLNIGLDLRASLQITAPYLELAQFVLPDHMPYAELWSRLRSDRLPWWFDGFYLSLVAICVALVVLWIQHRRMRRRPVLAGAALLAAGALATTSAAGYARTIDELNTRIVNDTYATDNLTAQINTSMDLLGQPERITRYDIAADLRDPAQPRFTTTLDLQNDGDTTLDRFTITLHNDLVVTQASLPFTRTGDYLVFDLPESLAPGKTLSATLSYGGALSSQSGLAECRPYGVARCRQASSRIERPACRCNPRRYVFVCATATIKHVHKTYLLFC